MKHGFELFATCILFLAVLARAKSVQSSDTNTLVSSCECFVERCGCCEHIDLSHIGIDGKLCSNVTYLSHDYGISITITYNTYTIFNETVSARNPPPICVGIPELEKIHAAVCVRFYDLSFEEMHFHGCAKASISVYHMIHKSVNLGCWNAPGVYPPVADANDPHILHNEIPIVKMI